MHCLSKCPVPQTPGAVLQKKDEVFGMTIRHAASTPNWVFSDFYIGNLVSFEKHGKKPGVSFFPKHKKINDEVELKH